jgi:ParB-like chromosome segregation protein Spo0J
LPVAVQDQVEQGSPAPATAYELGKVEDPEAQRDLAERVVTEGLNRAEVVEAVRSVKASEKSRGAGKSKSTGKTKVKPARLDPEIKHCGPHGCRIVIPTAARHTMADVSADLEGLVERLRVEMAPEMKPESQEAA